MKIPVFFLLLILSLRAPASGLPGELGNALAGAGIPSSHAGIYVREVSEKNPVIAWHAQEPMSPASTMKLVTTYAALSLLGPAHTWKTEAYVSGKVENGILKGPLILKGYGDPKLDIGRLWLFVNDLRARGLRDIEGGLVFDRSYFQVSGDPGKFDGKPYRPYNAIPDALLVNFEANSIRFVPDGNSIRLIALPDFSSLSVSNHLKSMTGPCGEWENGIAEQIESDGKSARLTLSGQFPASCGEKEDEIAAYDHSEYLFQLFSKLWSESGGKIEGGWQEGVVPPDAILLAATLSPPLSSLVTDMNKYSNNVMARQIFLTLGALKSPPATEESARLQVKTWLEEKGLSFPELVLDNGSGLSREAAISPMHLGKLLLDAYASPLMPTFFSSLPIAGIDGTMKKRLGKTQVKGRAYIKTGSLENVRAIAGLVQAKSGKRFVVVCIVEDPGAKRAKPFEDALLQWIEQNG